MIVATTYAIGAYHHYRREFDSRTCLCVLIQLKTYVSDLRHVGGFSPGTPASSTKSGVSLIIKCSRGEIQNILILNQIYLSYTIYF
jgi:hypothetical protein